MVKEAADGLSWVSSTLRNPNFAYPVIPTFHLKNQRFSKMMSNFRNVLACVFILNLVFFVVPSKF